MSRIARRDIGGPLLHVMVQGVNKEYIFYDKEHIERYIELIGKYKKDYDFTIISYCIMNNHAHFLIYTENVCQFGKFMQKVNLIYAQFYNKEQNRYGVLFRNRYKAECILNQKYLINCIKYIHDNPVKAGMVKKGEDYKYSSCSNYMKNRGECKSPIMQQIFGAECDFKLIFENLHLRRFIDVEEDMDTINEYIKEGIKEFAEEYDFKIYDIFSDREILKRLIAFLNENCNLKYVEIQNFLGITRGVMKNLRVK